MNASSRPGGSRRNHPSGQNKPVLGTPATITLITVTALLMAFSVIFWMLDNPTLAAVAGTAAVTLAVDIGRRLLGLNARDHRTGSSEGTR